MKRCLVCEIFACALVCCPGALTVAADAFRVSESQATITITRGDAAILTYNKKSPPVPEGIDPVYHRSAFLHPVNTPAGQVITAAFPADHAHQHGIFSAWVRTSYDGREIDFWNLAAGTGRVLHERVVSKFSDSLSAGFEVDLIHRAVAEPAVDLLRERWKVTVLPGDETFFVFDIESTQAALTDLPLVVQEYHYGGFAARGRVEWVDEKDGDVESGRSASQPSEFLNDLGSNRLAGNHQHARWVTLYGQLDGHPVSLTVLSHPDNFRFPQAARLHPTKPYFCYAPCVDGEFVIDKQYPLVSRYRYLVTDSEPNAAWIEKQFHSFEQL